MRRSDLAAFVALQAYRRDRSARELASALDARDRKAEVAERFDAVVAREATTALGRGHPAALAGWAAVAENRSWRLRAELADAETGAGEANAALRIAELRLEQARAVAAEAERAHRLASARRTQERLEAAASALRAASSASGAIDPLREARERD